jgi:hypothetical protein
MEVIKMIILDGMLYGTHTKLWSDKTKGIEVYAVVLEKRYNKKKIGIEVRYNNKCKSFYSDFYGYVNKWNPDTKISAWTELKISAWNFIKTL